MRARGGGIDHQHRIDPRLRRRAEARRLLGVEGRADDADAGTPRRCSTATASASTRSTSGWTLTEGERRVKREQEGKGEDWIEEAIATRPFGRLLAPLDIAYAAAYFASDESECVTGSVLDLEQYPPGAPAELVSTSMPAAPRFSVFPKCYFDELVRGEMDYVAWIPIARRRSAAKGSSTTTGSSAASTTPTSIRCVAAMARDRPGRARCSASRRTSRTRTPTSGRGRSSGRRRPSICA